MSTTRDLIVETTCDLLECQGFHATGLNQIVKQSGAPKGSLYHYFPAGKDEIAEAAIARAGRTVAERITAALAVSDNAAEAVRGFVLWIAERVEESAYASGGPLATVAMETATTNERLNRACRVAYSQLQGAFEAKLVQAGFGEAQAQQLAMFITASIEGGTILCRAYHTGDPLRLVAEQLSQMIAASTPAAAVPRADDEASGL